MVAMRFDERVDDAAAGLSAALSTMESSGRIAGSFGLYLVFFSASLVFPLAALALLFAMGASDWLLRPVAALSDAIARVGAGARRAPFLAKPGDEAGDLVEAFNAVLENLERSRGDEVRNEKIGAWRDIARKLAHELRNPLTPIRLSAERVLKRWKADPGSLDEILEKSMVAIVQETANMESLLTEFRDFARLPEPQKEWMELKSTIDEAVHLYSASWPALSMDSGGVDEGIVLKADRGYLKQALGNLIANAADATGGSGHVWIRADLVKTAESRYCRIQVRDDGTGIPAEARDKIFSPYFTTKPGGTGLGLAIVAHIVSAHGGKVRFDSSEGAGTVFYMDIPAESS
jgi:nitrogen fixation/metabolism regulation signal transduction histidine kinase